MTDRIALNTIKEPRMNKDIKYKIIHGTRCTVTGTKNGVEIDMCVGAKQRFKGKNYIEAEQQMWNWMRHKPGKKGGGQEIEDETRKALSALDMPKEHIRVSDGYARQHPIYRSSWTVRRSLGHTQKIYFGTYRNEHAAKAASIRLCELINEEVDKRHFVRKTTPHEGLLFKKPNPRRRRYTPQSQQSIAGKTVDGQTIAKQTWEP